MGVATDEWLARLEQEYVSEFITAGGSAVKFVVGDGGQLTTVAKELDILSQQHDLAYIPIDAAATKLHMSRIRQFRSGSGLRGGLNQLLGLLCHIKQRPCLRILAYLEG